MKYVSKVLFKKIYNMNYYFEIIVFNSALSDILKKTATFFLEIFRHAALILCIHVFSEFSGYNLIFTFANEQRL